jgi:hypothetical protein
MPRSFCYRQRLTLVLGLLQAIGIPGLADCAGLGTAPINLVPQTCLPISTAQGDATILARARSKGLPGGLTTLVKLYTEALVTDLRNQQLLYASSAKDPCRSFPPGRKIRMMAYFSCCDTGIWGKCVFGGRFLGDIGALPINAFQ